MADNQVTAEEYTSWLPPNEALKRVANHMQDWDVAAEAILRRLDAGLVRAHVKTGKIEHSGRRQNLKPFVAIPAEIIMVWTKSPYIGRLQFWQSGDAEVRVRTTAPHGYDIDTIWTLFGIRFDPAGIAEMIGAPAPAPPPVPATGTKTAPATPVTAPIPSRPGRPPLDFWEDMVIAATKAIWYEATLQPKTQADVLRWMTDWAIARGHAPGETALKERARRVFLATQD